MYKFLSIAILFTFVLLAREEVLATVACPAFNNMKHSRNTHNVMLDTSKTYTVLRYHKGQALILIKGETPAQRWVDKKCFNKSLTKPTQKDNTKKYEENDTNKYHSPKSKYNLLALSWHNAFCETHRYKKECKRGVGSLLRTKSHESAFVLHGLWPQPRDNVYCDVEQSLVTADKNRRWRELPTVVLSLKVEEKLKEVMPSFSAGLHKHEWIKHGSCYGTDANTYYAEAMTLVEQLNRSALGKLFNAKIGKQIRLQEVRRVADRTFGKGAGNRISLQCKGGLVTELWLQLGSGSEDLATLLHRGKKIYSRCKGGYVDRAGFGR